MRVNSSLYWEQVPGSLCGSRSGSSSSIWGRVTRANAWPLHWPTEWRCLGLGHTNLWFNTLFRWFKDKNHWSKETSSSKTSRESDFFWRDLLTFWILAWESNILQIFEMFIILGTLGLQGTPLKEYVLLRHWKLFNNSHCSFGPSGNQPSPASWAQANSFYLKKLPLPLGSHS